MIALALALGMHVCWPAGAGTLALVDMRGFAWVLPDDDGRAYVFVPFCQLRVCSP